jgi:uncharacterized protein YutE (UPF0331/DUF86 family)
MWTENQGTRVMNERFIKLALDAGLLNYVDHETPRRYFVHGHAEQEEVEKFAQLIVQECIDTVKKRFMGDLNREDMEVKRCIEDLKKHFGVE